MDGAPSHILSVLPHASAGPLVGTALGRPFIQAHTNDGRHSIAACVCLSGECVVEVAQDPRVGDGPWGLCYALRLPFLQ